VKNHSIAERYSAAVMGLVRKNDTETLSKDLKILSNLFSDDHTIKILGSAILNIHQKKEIITAITEKLELPFWNNFFLLLAKKHRLGIINDILEDVSFRNLVINRKIKAELILSQEMDSSTISKIKGFLDNYFKKDVILEISIDNSIIGGFIAKTESVTIDASVLQNLNNFIASLKNE